MEASSSFTAIRSAWKVRVAGWMRSPRRGETDFDDGDQLTGRVKRSRFDDGSRDLARVPLFAVLVDQVSQFPF